VAAYWSKVTTLVHHLTPSLRIKPSNQAERRQIAEEKYGRLRVTSLSSNNAKRSS